MDDVAAQDLRARIEHGDALIEIRELSPDDVHRVSWSGGPTHLENIARELERVPSGEVEYLAVHADGVAVCKGGIDFAKEPGSGTIWQVATHPVLEGLGLATMLIRALEDRSARRDIPTTRLAVELDNHRAQRLYEHLGYRPVGEAEESWISDRPDGSTFLYRTTVAVLAKEL